MESTFPVSDPGWRTDAPEKMETSTFLPSRSALPTSISCWIGCPIKIRDESEEGTNRTRPVLPVSQFLVTRVHDYSRLNARDDIAAATGDGRSGDGQVSVV